MQAIRYHRPGKIELEELPVPAPAEDEVLISVTHAGICGTDLHIIAEESPAAAEVVLGHEFAGTVVSTGDWVQHVKAGDRVAVDPNNYCGKCQYCRKGQVHFCKNLHPLGVFRDGGWAQYCCAPDRQVYLLPPEVPLAWGALGEPLSCILHGWDRLKPIAADSKTLIIGSGIVGLLWGLILQKMNQRDFLISEPNENRRELAENLGFTTIHPGQLSANTNQGFDVIIDCSGSPLAIHSAIQYINPLGKILFFGVCPEDSRMEIEPFQVFKKELTLIGSVINPFTFSRALEFIPHIMQPIEKLGVRFFKLSQYREAIAVARAGKAAKVMFTP